MTARPPSAAVKTAAIVDQILRAGVQPPTAHTNRLATRPGWTDQADAAAADLRAGIARLAADGHDVRTAAYGQCPRWLTRGIAEVLTRWALGDLQTCRHRPTPAAPQPVHSAAWCTDLIVCSDCVDLLELPDGSALDRLCDGCGRTCAGPALGDPIWPRCVVGGLLTFAVGVCRHCRAELEP